MTDTTSVAAPSSLPAAMKDILPAGEALTPAEQQDVEKLMNQIDITDPVMSLSWGAKTMGEISRFSDALLEQVQAKDAGVVGEQLTDLLSKVKEVDLTSFSEKPGFLASVPLVGKLFNRLERTLLTYQTLARQVENISARLEEAMVDLLRNISTLEQLFIRNRDYYQQINLHIIAGKLKIAQLQNIDMPLAQQHAADDALKMQTARDLEANIQRFERRLHDLMLSRTIAIQTAPQIRLMQGNSQSLAEKIQSSLLTTIPVWKTQLVLALSLHTQRQATKLQKDVSDTTNDMLRRNAELLQTGTVETAREVERSVVDIDTLRDVHARLLTTIEESVAIASNARASRQSVEKELSVMEDELRTRLSAIASGTAHQA
ncbi:toxic anion resistance protein [Cronobacter muytjensii]|uniref:toxic anion resistance protein n=1 Tax=Cronobacter TaxID=413496 RepID=UPI000283FA7F|nr:MULTISPECIES: toxic anion resistance protein [Cronobacter]ALB69126.1 Tellurite resistance protein [Cronobacter muytjensii ATCC 51329]EGT4340464.1 toxic anion resistance protein [Cronobacter muytjensii]ELY2496905.1 toxic anion resistance protein [Cronobacter muytjensii]ELY3983315.1 toxic anion resistance protein [Cronobacter muytjensii]ELY4662954.1 toxic anion resistance protein [Cronobacter muytjensii]